MSGCGNCQLTRGLCRIEGRLITSIGAIASGIFELLIAAAMGATTKELMRRAGQVQPLRLSRKSSGGETRTLNLAGIPDSSR